jgi:hypothetical protein
MLTLIPRLADRLDPLGKAIAVVFLFHAGACFTPVFADDSEYVPTMRDMMSIQDALGRYHEGLDKHDNKLMAAAFGDDGIIIMVVNGRELGTVKKDQIALTGVMLPGGPPPGAAPGPAGGSDSTRPPMEPGDLWHFTDINGSFKFESATRVVHYAYWMDVHVHQESFSSTLGVPGHYEDVLVKRNGKWLFLSRKICVGTK